MQVCEGRPARPSVNTVCPLSGYWQHWRHHDNIMLREGDISGRAGTGVCCRWSAAEAEAGGGEDTSAVVAVRLRTPASMVSPSPVCPVSPSPHPQHPGDKCPHWSQDPACTSDTPGLIWGDKISKSFNKSFYLKQQNWQIVIEIKLKVQISRYLSTQLYIIYINTNQRKADRRGSSEKWDDRYPILDNFCSDIASKQKALLEGDSFIGYQCYEWIQLRTTQRILSWRSKRLYL